MAKNLVIIILLLISGSFLLFGLTEQIKAEDALDEMVKYQALSEKQKALAEQNADEANRLRTKLLECQNSR